MTEATTYHKPRLNKATSLDTSPGLHAALDLADLVAAGHHPDEDLPGARLLLLQVGVDAVLDVRAQLRGRQPLGVELVILSLPALRFQTVITGEAEGGI